LTPAEATTDYGQVSVCNGTMARHAVLRAGDLHDGLIRWNCGDTPGVTPEPELDSRDGYGQEYCEYHGVSGGRITADGEGLRDDAKISCVFTSLFVDATPSAVGRATEALAQPDNLGVQPEPGVVQMQVEFNSRKAATELIRDCSTEGQGRRSEQAERAVACWQAVQRASGEDKRRLEKACCKPVAGASPARCSKTEIDDDDWDKARSLGARILKRGESGVDAQRDLIDCVRGRRFGVPWRNSDPTICSRTLRAASECDCRYNDLPSALDGFEFTGWTSDSLPAGCRYAKSLDASGTPTSLRNIVICELTQQDKDDLATGAYDLNGRHNLQKLCHDRFAKEIVLRAPIRAVEAAGTCRASTPFCSAYTGR
jgi:hypothetical protein